MTKLARSALRERSAFRAGTTDPLAGLVEALAPLGMPDMRYASRRTRGDRVARTRAATYLVRVRPVVVNLAMVVVIHLAAIRYVFLPIGTV
jgi:hypothetical protein